MSHYDSDLDVEWAVVVESKPSRERVSFADMSRLELKLVRYILEQQGSISKMVEIGAFFGGVKQGFLGQFAVEDETRVVIAESQVDVDDAVFKFRKALRNDDIISALYRLRVPFRVIAQKKYRDDRAGAVSAVFQIAETVELLESIPPEPESVIRKRDEGAYIVGEFLGTPRQDVEYIVQSDEEFPGCSLGEWESIIGRDLTDEEVFILEELIEYYPEPTGDGFERGVERGEDWITTAEEVWQSVGLDVQPF